MGCNHNNLLLFPFVCDYILLVLEILHSLMSLTGRVLSPTTLHPAAHTL